MMSMDIKTAITVFGFIVFGSCMAFVVYIILNMIERIVKAQSEQETRIQELETRLKFYTVYTDLVTKNDSIIRKNIENGKIENIM